MARRATALFELAAILVTGGAFFALVGLFLILFPFATSSSYNLLRDLLLIGGLLTAGIGVVLAVRAVMSRLDNDAAVIAGEYLTQHFDDRYTFVRHIRKRGVGYIDAVLVGPPGALVMRILDVEGYFVNDGADWLRGAQGRRLAPAGINPSREAAEDVQKLREYLAKQNLADVPVYGVVVFTQQPPQLTFQSNNALVPAAYLSDLRGTLRGSYLTSESRLPAPEAVAVVRLLLA